MAMTAFSNTQQKTHINEQLWQIIVWQDAQDLSPVLKE